MEAYKVLSVSFRTRYCESRREELLAPSCLSGKSKEVISEPHVLKGEERFGRQKRKGQPWCNMEGCLFLT